MSKMLPSQEVQAQLDAMPAPKWISVMEDPFIDDARRFVLRRHSDLREESAYPAYLQQLVRHSLASPEEIAAAEQGEWQASNPVDKMRPYSQLVAEMAAYRRAHPKATIALVLLTANPQHFGHAKLVRAVRHACRAQNPDEHRVLVGIDSRVLVERRKGRQWISRAAAALNIACLPWPDYVFVNPWAESEGRDLNTFYEDISRELGANFLACGADNPLSDTYRARAAKLGAQLLLLHDQEPYSSTQMMRDNDAFALSNSLDVGGPEMEEALLWEDRRAKATLARHGFHDEFLEQ